MSFNYSSHIQVEYGLQGILNFELVHDGPDNQVFLVTDGNGSTYALRAGKRDAKDLFFETELLANLASAGFSSPRLVKTRSGSWSVMIEGIRMVLFEFIPGWQIEKLEARHLATDLIQRGAGKLGSLHQLTKDMKMKAVSVRTIFTEYERLLALGDEALEQFKGHETFLEQANSFLKQARERLDRDQEAVGIIHNDYRIQNLIFTDTDCWIIDFDWACPGPLLKDVGLAISEWSLFKSSVGPSREAIDAFIESYNTTSPEAVHYDKDLLFWVCFACLSDACTFFVDVTQGRYAEKDITDVDQCYMYRKFKYFFNELNNQ